MLFRSGDISQSLGANKELNSKNILYKREIHGADEIFKSVASLEDFGLSLENYFGFSKEEYELLHDKEVVNVSSLDAIVEQVKNIGRKGLDVQRYKGLGEMNPDQLWTTTMNPETRTLFKVKLEDASEAERLFSVLMGTNVEPRRDFIEKHALEVRNLDI